jgi:hypothetical protein
VPYSAQQNRVEFFELFERAVGKRFACSHISFAAKIKILIIDFYAALRARRVKYFSRFRCDLRSCSVAANNCNVVSFCHKKRLSF